MKGERLYEAIPIEVEGCGEMGVVSLDELRLGRRFATDGTVYFFYYLGNYQTERFQLTEEAARQLRDQLNEALAEKSQAPVSWIARGIPFSGVGTSHLLLAGCTCGKPWMSTAPPPPCPVHGPAQSLKMTCEG